jgi:hypothetical protein
MFTATLPELSFESFNLRAYFQAVKIFPKLMTK